MRIRATQIDGMHVSMLKLRENRFALYNEIFNKNPPIDILFSDFCAQRGIHMHAYISEVSEAPLQPSEFSPHLQWHEFCVSILPVLPCFQTQREPEHRMDQ